jgi:hypothetical protein
MATGNANNSSIGDGLVDDAGIDGYSALYDQIHSMYRERDIAGESGDPNPLMTRERAANDAEYEGLSGFLRYGIHKFYGLFSPDEDPSRTEEQYKNAEQASQAANRKIEATSEGNSNKNAFRQLASELQGKSWLSRQPNDADKLRAAKLEAAGDVRGASRQEIDEGFSDQERSLDPYDDKERTRLQEIHQQALANYDAEAARQSKLQEAQSNDRIAALQEEANDARLRGEGKTDEAGIAALKFQTEQCVRSLQEQADAEGDSTRKAQLQKEAAAAADAGKTERDALQKELQRTNAQSPALAAATAQAGTGANGLAGASGNNLAEVSKKLDDAATKLDKAISNLKTLVLLKD